MVDGRKSEGHRSQPVRITTAPDNPRKEIAHRERRYLISMGIRTACFVAAVAVRGTWYCWVLIALAFILPYVAVVMANAASPRIPGADLRESNDGHRELK